MKSRSVVVVATGEVTDEGVARCCRQRTCGTAWGGGYASTTIECWATNSADFRVGEDFWRHEYRGNGLRFLADIGHDVHFAADVGNQCSDLAPELRANNDWGVVALQASSLLPSW